MTLRGGSLKRVALRRPRVRSALLLAVAFPTIGLMVLSGTSTVQSQALAQEAVFAERGIDALLVLAELGDRVRYERIDASLFVASNELQVDLDQLYALAGRDLEGVGTRRQELDDTWDRLVEMDRSDEARGVTPWVDDGLRSAITALAGVRASLDRSTASTADLVRVYSALKVEVSDRAQSTIRRLADRVNGLRSGSAELRRVVAATAAWVGVIDDVGHETAVLGSMLLGGVDMGDEPVLDGALEDPQMALIEFGVRRRQNVEEMEAWLTPELLEAWRGYQANPAWAELEQSFQRAIDAPASDVATLSMAGLDATTAGPVILAGVDALAGMMGDLGAAATQAARAVRTEALDSSAFHLWVSVLLVIPAVVVTWASIHSISVPLQRLQERARRVRDGDLEDDGSQRGTGFAEVAMVGSVFEEVADHLRVVQDQTTALAAGRLDDPSMAVELPGLLGQALQESVRRLRGLQAQLVASEALSKAIVDTAAEAIWLLDAGGVVRTANAAVTTMVGIEERALVDTPFSASIANRQTARAFERSIADGSALDSVGMDLIHQEGHLVPVLLSTSRVTTGGGDLVTVFARDITEIKALELQLVDQARSDPLTGLANRRAIVEALTSALARSRRSGSAVGVVFGDLNGFKKVNDTLGHAAGDELLKQVSARLSATLRGGETLGRIGGDEFVLVLEGLDSTSGAVAAATRLLSQFDTPFEVQGQQLDISGCFGISCGRSPEADANRLLTDADHAMYRAKKSGHRQVQVADTDFSGLGGVPGTSAL